MMQRDFFIGSLMYGDSRFKLEDTVDILCDA